MKRLGMFLSAVAVLLVAASVVQAATDIEKFSIKGESVEAFFSKAEGVEECEVTSVGVYAFEQAVRQKPAPVVKESVASVYIDVYNECIGEYITSAYGSGVLDADNFVVGNKLSSASLNAVVEVYDYVTGNTMEVIVDVSWDAVEPLVKSSSRSTYKSEGFSFKDFFRGSFRIAEATGDIEVDGSDLDLGQADHAAIMNLTGSSITKTTN